MTERVIVAALKVAPVRTTEAQDFATLRRVETTAVTLDKASEKDLDIVRMINSSLKNEKHTGFIDEDDMQEVYRWGTIFIIKVYGKNAGTISFRPDRGDDNTALLRNLAILPRYQGRGVGTAAVNLIHDTVKELGFEKAKGRIRPENDEVLHIYKKKGFEVVGKDNCFGDGVERLIIEKRLR